jgi:hypothetical protein
MELVESTLVRVQVIGRESYGGPMMQDEVVRVPRTDGCARGMHGIAQSAGLHQPLYRGDLTRD